MSVLPGHAPVRLLRMMLGLALIGLVVVPSASGAARLDMVTVTGNASSLYSNINISAQSGTAGQNPSGHVSLNIGPTSIAGPVTSLTVTDNSALIGVQTSQFGSQTVKVVDNGGHGADMICVWSGAPPPCTMVLDGELFDVTSSLSNGRAVVFDAPDLPTTRAECKNGGWRNFGTMFKNQGQCVGFVMKQARQKCLTERAKIGLLAFRDKYGLGPYHVRAMRRCVNQASR